MSSSSWMGSRASSSEGFSLGNTRFVDVEVLGAFGVPFGISMALMLESVGGSIEKSTGLSPSSPLEETQLDGAIARSISALSMFALRRRFLVLLRVACHFLTSLWRASAASSLSVPPPSECLPAMPLMKGVRSSSSAVGLSSGWNCRHWSTKEVKCSDHCCFFMRFLAALIRCLIAPLFADGTFSASRSNCSSCWMYFKPSLGGELSRM
mmetsp:Transcript_18359/g.70940  ORF Transcript_18359/g.70940 Transcript_18359/m.70940 type:complete len:209 (+) Transcript_18359:1276-1902(+)